MARVEELARGIEEIDKDTDFLPIHEATIFHLADDDDRRAALTFTKLDLAFGDRDLAGMSAEWLPLLNCL